MLMLRLGLRLHLKREHVVILPQTLFEPEYRVMTAIKGSHQQSAS